MTKEDCLRTAHSLVKIGNKRAKGGCYDGAEYCQASFYFLAAEKFEKVASCMEKWLVIKKRELKKFAERFPFGDKEVREEFIELRRYEELIKFLKNERLVRKLGQFLFSKPYRLTDTMLTEIGFTKFDAIGRKWTEIAITDPVEKAFPPKVAPLFIKYIPLKPNLVIEVRKELVRR